VTRGFTRDGSIQLLAATTVVALSAHRDVLTQLRYEQYAGTNGQTDKFPDYQLSGDRCDSVTAPSATSVVPINGAEDSFMGVQRGQYEYC
jgi:hypothetical protein